MVNTQLIPMSTNATTSPSAAVDEFGKPPHSPLPGARFLFSNLVSYLILQPWFTCRGAKYILNLAIARLLWGFNVEHGRDGNGNIIPVDFTTDGLVPGALSNPFPYKCCRYFWDEVDCSDYDEVSEEGEDFETDSGLRRRRRE